MHFDKRIGRVRLLILDTNASPTFLYGAEIRILMGNTEHSTNSHLSLDELMDLRYLIDRALGK